MNYKGFLFDLDDTLIDRKNAYEYMYRIFYDSRKEINSSMTWEHAKEFFWNLSPNGAADQKKSIEAINKKWPSIPNDHVEHKRFYFETMIQGLNPLPNSYDLIKKMNSLDIKWGIVTNGDHYQFKKIEKVGWEKLIPFLLASDIYGSKKPDPKIYHEAVRLLDIGINKEDYSEILFIGDNPYTDIMGAYNVGMKTAWIKMDNRDYPNDAPYPDLIINNVEELSELF